MKLLAKSGKEEIQLYEHLLHVGEASRRFASYLNMDEQLAWNGAILHDLGKAHPVFQEKLTSKNETIFRHEISSLLFLSVFPEEQWPELVEMVVAHHKSVKIDAKKLGLLDLEENSFTYEQNHIGDWSQWSKEVFSLLNQLGIKCDPFGQQQAEANLRYCINYCKEVTKEEGASSWRGLLMGADHFASAANRQTSLWLKNVFKLPKLSFYNRQNKLYPLSLKNVSSDKKHTLAVACTGAGKTDFLFRRCRSRVFYTLPFQASINAMYYRVKHELRNENPDLDIRLLHASSKVKANNKEEEVLQSLFGSAVKVLTPFQLASVAFGLKGYEATLLDLTGCDVILDEIHTYTGNTQAIVLKIVEVLVHHGCRLHIGTATMPTVLYESIKKLLDNDVLEISLTQKELDKFDRHIVYKLPTFEKAFAEIDSAVNDKQKVLIVANQVEEAVNLFKRVEKAYPKVETLLLHSRFKRGDRNKYEKLLLGIDENSQPTGQFNTGRDACIVVSTQIVEVSLDISFDMMITACAPMDALIQRFGRVNRKRTKQNQPLKSIYVIAPPDDNKQARPYELATIKATYDILPNGLPLRERNTQHMIDEVYPSINFIDIDEDSIFEDGHFQLGKLKHRKKSILFEKLEIDSVSCITESDQYDYESNDLLGFTSLLEKRMLMEIPVRYYVVQKCHQSKTGSRPFVIPDQAYSKLYGLDQKLLKDGLANLKPMLL